MSEENLKQHDAPSENGNDYQTPAIEQVVTREGIEREVAYAGVPGPSVNIN